MSDNDRVQGVKVVESKKGKDSRRDSCVNEALGKRPIGASMTVHKKVTCRPERPDVKA